MEKRWYWGVLKNGVVRFFENKPKRAYVEEIIEHIDGFGQHKLHFLDAYDKDGKLIMKCDFESVCGYDRGVRFPNLIRKMLKGTRYAKD